MSYARPVVLHEDDVPLESWSEEASDRVAWRTLFSGGRTPTRGLTLGVAELPPGGPPETVAHRHAQIEAYYVLAGEGVVVIDGERHAVRVGSAVFLPGDVQHVAANTGRETLRLLYVFDADSFDEVQYHFSTEPTRIR